MLLDWLGRKHADESLLIAAKAMEQAVERALASGMCTPDLGGNMGTEEFAEAVLRAIAPDALP
jgi:3-isopropylmalate dehydrogenase